MADWGPLFVAVVMFILLTPGLLIQITGKNYLTEFANMHTSRISIFINSIIYFAAISVLLLAVGVHVYAG